MRHETQVALIRQALRAIDEGRPPLTEAFTTNEAAAYTSPERLRLEREILFTRHPIVVGFSSQVRRPGDWFSEDLGAVPILVVRDRSGVLRAFANICRHRGSRLVEGSGSGARDFTCPYHSWSYDTEGCLRAIPDEFGFAGLDKREKGLVSLPVRERHGLVWVLSQPGGSFEVDGMLGGLEEDLEGYRSETYVHHATRVSRRRMNWKLASDTFWEAYHLKILHQTTVGPIFLRNVGVFDPFGRNHRFVGFRKSVEELRKRPESEWDLLPHATILMNLFPNTILIMQTDHMEAYRVFPVGDGVNECATAVSVLVPEAEANQDARWNRTMDLILGVIDQDYTASEGIQRNFESGVVPQVVYGRFEGALEHFHRSIRETLAER